MPKPPLLGEVASSVSEDDGEVVRSSTCVIPLTLKASFVQPLSLADARQLPWQGSPWQRGVVFDEADLRLLKNVTECQSLSLWERCLRSRRRGQGCCQKAKNTAIQALFVRDIVSLCFRVLFCRACPLRRWRASSPKGRALGKEVKPSCTPPCRGRQADSTPSG